MKDFGGLRGTHWAIINLKDAPREGPLTRPETLGPVSVLETCDRRPKLCSRRLSVQLCLDGSRYRGETGDGPGLGDSDSYPQT